MISLQSLAGYKNGSVGDIIARTRRRTILRALREIRVRAAPGWDADAVSLTFWFIKEQEPQGVTPAWSDWTDEWIGLIDRSGRYRIEVAVACRLRDLTAQDYIESDRLDLDFLSGP